MPQVTTLFLDIGGVLMTNGWDRHMREKAAHDFDIDLADFDQRHRQFYDIYEQGKISLDEYLHKTLFWTERSFSLERFKEFMFAQSKPFPDMIGFFSQLKKEYGIRIAVISNEGRELMDYRIKKAHLKEFVDDFFVSSFLGYQKPDSRIFKMALDVTQTPVRQAFYIDDRAELVAAASQLGIKSIQQTSLQETSKVLKSVLNEGR